MCSAPKEYESGPPVKRIMNFRGRNARYFKAARKAAHLSAAADYKHGAILVKGGSILNTSPNKNNFCSFGARFRNDLPGIPTLHAELGAILGISREMTAGSTIYVCRVGKSGVFKLSKPCPMCVAAMKHVGIKRVVWSIDEHSCAMARL